MIFLSFREGPSMKLEWMGEYRGVVEALIHYCNLFSGV